MDGDGGGGVVAGVAPAEGVGGDALAEIAVGIAPADPLVDGGFKVALNVDIGAQLHKDAGHAGVLADGQAGLTGGGQIVAEEPQGGLGQGPGLGGPGRFQSGFHVGGQVGVGLDAEGRHCLGDPLGGDGSHGVPSLQPGHAGFPGSLGHGLGHALGHAGVKGVGNDVLIAALGVGNQVGDGVGGGQLHLVVDVPGPH